MNFDTMSWLPILGAFLFPRIAMTAIFRVIAGFAPDLAERAKKNLPNIVLGVILFSIASVFATALYQAAGGTP